jgi:hypothetical protein
MSTVSFRCSPVYKSVCFPRASDEFHIIHSPLPCYLAVQITLLVPGSPRADSYHCGAAVQYENSLKFPVKPQDYGDYSLTGLVLEERHSIATDTFFCLGLEYNPYKGIPDE